MKQRKPRTAAARQDALLPSEILRELIQERLEGGVTLYRVAVDAGVPWQTVHRFMRRERSLSLASFDQLCRSLGLHLKRGR